MTFCQKFSESHHSHSVRLSKKREKNYFVKIILLKQLKSLKLQFLRNRNSKLRNGLVIKNGAKNVSVKIGFLEQAINHFR